MRRYCAQGWNRLTLLADVVPDNFTVAGGEGLGCLDAHVDCCQEGWWLMWFRGGGLDGKIGIL